MAQLLYFSDDFQVLKIRVKVEPARPRILGLNSKPYKARMLIPDLQHPVRWRRHLGQSPPVSFCTPSRLRPPSLLNRVRRPRPRAKCLLADRI